MVGRNSVFALYAFGAQAVLGQSCATQSSPGDFSGYETASSSCLNTWAGATVPAGGVLALSGRGFGGSLDANTEGICICPGQEDKNDFTDVLADLSNKQIINAGSWVGQLKNKLLNPQCQMKDDSNYVARRINMDNRYDIQDVCGIRSCGTGQNSCIGQDYSVGGSGGWSYRQNAVYCQEPGETVSPGTEMVAADGDQINSASRGCGSNKGLQITNIPCNAVSAYDYCADVTPNPTPAPTPSSTLAPTTSQAPTAADICTDDETFEGFYLTNPEQAKSGVEECWVYTLAGSTTVSGCHDNIDSVALAFEAAIGASMAPGTAPTMAPTAAPQGGCDANTCFPDSNGFLTQCASDSCKLASAKVIGSNGIFIFQGKSQKFSPADSGMTDDDWKPKKDTGAFAPGLYGCVCQGAQGVDTLLSEQVVTAELSNDGSWTSIQTNKARDGRTALQPVCYDTETNTVKREIPFGPDTDECNVRGAVCGADIPQSQECLNGGNPGGRFSYAFAYTLCNHIQATPVNRYRMLQSGDAPTYQTGCSSNKNFFFTDISCPLTLRAQCA